MRTAVGVHTVAVTFGHRSRAFGPSQVRRGNGTKTSKGSWLPIGREERVTVVLQSRRPQKVLVEFVNTLADPTLFDQLYKLAQNGPTEFHLVMPIVRPDYGLAWTDAQARRDADDRLAIMLEFMARAGMSVTGEVRPEAPEEAVMKVARGSEGPFDKVVAIWRERKYRWLYGGVREQLEGELGIPVESLHVEPPVAHSNVEDADHLRTLFEEYASRLGWKIAQPHTTAGHGSPASPVSQHTGPGERETT
jgi:hypothetical protein